MQLAGIPVRYSVVLELISMLRRGDYAHTADTLEGALATHQRDVALTINDRIAILNVLDDPPPGLEELRAVLLQEHAWRQHQRL